MSLTGLRTDAAAERSAARAADTLSILHVTTGLEIGGGETLLCALTDAAHGRGRTTAVVSLMADGPMRRRFEAAGVPLYDLGMRRGVPSLGGIVRLVRLIRELKPDLVQAWLYHGIIGATVALALSGRRSRTRLVHGIYGSSIDFRSYGLPLRLAFRLAAWLSRTADAAIYNTRVGEAYHRDQGFAYRRAVTIDNGVDTRRYVFEPAARTAMRDRLGLAPSEVAVIAVARVDPMKGWERLLRLAETIPGIRLVAVGRGTEAFPPHPSRILLGARDDVPALLAAADVFVIPSLFGEGTSVALTEAMASGLPVIATDVGDHARIAAGCGRVMAPDDEAGLAAALAELAGDAGLRHSLGAAARAKVAREYGIDRALDDYYRLYGELVRVTGHGR